MILNSTMQHRIFWKTTIWETFYQHHYKWSLRNSYHWIIFVLDCFGYYFSIFFAFLHIYAHRYRYQEQTPLWWFVLWEQFGKSILRTCGGLKFMGAVEDSSTLKSYLSKINFIVPRHSILKPLYLEFPRNRPAGMFTDVIYFLAERTQPDVLSPVWWKAA